MGCDIHLFVEYKKDGKWLTADHWESSRYENGKMAVPYRFEFYGARHYYLFSKLSECGRCIDNKPIAEPRGFPQDASEELTKYRDDDDGHSDSWITYSELKKEDWSDINKYPEEWRVCLGRLRGLLFDKNVNEDEIRIVFWFDN